MYLQSALAHLSRLLLYLGLPAIDSALLMLRGYTGAVETPIDGGPLEVVVAVVIILVFIPLFICLYFNFGWY